MITPPHISHIRIPRLMHFSPFYTLSYRRHSIFSTNTPLHLAAAVCLALMRRTHIISVSVAALIPITSAVIRHCNLLFKG